MKKSLIILFLLIIVSSSAVAGDFSFAFEDARFHNDFFFGFAPFYVRAGVDYSGFEIIDGQRTDLFIIGGGALIHSKIWTDKSGLPVKYSDTTASDFKDANSYSKFQGDFSLRLEQGLFQEKDRDKPLLAGYVKYAFHWTSPHENWNGGISTFLDGDLAAYPDNKGTASNILQTGIKIDRLDKTDVYNGFRVDSSVKWAPKWFFNDIRGSSSFVNLNLTAKGYYSLFEIKRADSDLTLIGIYLADRVQIDYLSGDAIPQFFQEGASLGTKMRGFESNSLGTEFTVVNNFDIRIYGTEFLNNINPVLQLFFDSGFQSGNYFNTEYNAGGNFFCSTGFEIALNIIDFAQVGYLFGFPLVGQNIQQKTMLGHIIFRYKF